MADGRVDLRPDPCTGCQGSQMSQRWQAILIAGVVVSMVSVFAYDTLHVATAADALTRCEKNMHALGLAMMQYQIDYDGRLPEADRWVDQVRPYVKNPKVFRCPADRTAGRCSYAMNTDLSGKRESEIEDASNTVLLYEPAHAGHNPHGTGRDLPARGRHRYPKSFAKVTLYGFLFADGAWYTRERPFEPPLRWVPNGGAKPAGE
jgi:hypothetical protein